MGNRVSQPRRGRTTETEAEPRAVAGRAPNVLTEMTPDQFVSLPQVTAALRRSGLESCNMIVGIDFTKSNEWSGKSTFGGRCLHEIDNLSASNPYEDVIETIGKTLHDFDEDNVIPVYGFGDDRTSDRAVFSLASAEGQAGFPLEDIRPRYREVVRNVVMAGPTSFAPIINQAVKIVSQTGNYHILVIVADGQVTRSVDIPPHAVSKNEKETVDAIRYASHFPLSIVMVGVGDGPWEAMKYFDNYLVHRKFDNFQFVEYHQITSQFSSPGVKETQFALQALMDIPDQYRAIKTLKYLKRGPHKFRTDLPNVRVLPAPRDVQRAFTSNYGVDQLNTQSQRDSHVDPTVSYASSAIPSAPMATFHAEEGAEEGASQFGGGETAGVQPSMPNHMPSQTDDELLRLQEKLLCAICEENAKDMAFQCGHQTCQRCGDQLSKCPICRQEIQVRLKLDKIHLVCALGHEFGPVALGETLDGKHSCPRCRGTSSLPEARTIFLVDKILGQVFNKTRRVLPSKLELNGFCERLQLAVEYGGRQHSEWVPFFHATPEAWFAQIERDEIKHLDAKALKINLITIHHTLKTTAAIGAYLVATMRGMKFDVPDQDWVALDAEFEKRRPVATKASFQAALAWDNAAMMLAAKRAPSPKRGRPVSPLRKEMGSKVRSTSAICGHCHRVVMLYGRVALVSAHLDRCEAFQAATQLGPTSSPALAKVSRWPKFTKLQRLILRRSVAALKPYEAPHGHQAEAWQGLANRLNVHPSFADRVSCMLEV